MKIPQEPELPAHWSEPMRLATLAAARGDPEAQIALGRMYERGDGFPQNFPEAMRWYMKAAATCPRAKYLVGLMYANGRGVARDRTTALRWITEAAESGSAEAQHMLGSMYARGKGMPKDPEKAAAWFRLAAESGEAGAQLVYGLMLRDGRGVARDDMAAYMWIARAAAHPSSGQRREVALEALESVARRLDPAQMKEAQRRLRAAAVDGSGAPPAPVGRERTLGVPVPS